MAVVSNSSPVSERFNRYSRGLGRNSISVPNGLVENTLEVPLGQGGTFKVLVCLDVLGALQGLVIGYRLHFLLSEALEGLRVFSQIKLGANEDDRDVGSMVVDFWEPL